jgi:LPXTG-motif cell wall-anchored protein
MSSVEVMPPIAIAALAMILVGLGWYFTRRR